MKLVIGLFLFFITSFLQASNNQPISNNLRANSAPSRLLPEKNNKNNSREDSYSTLGSSDLITDKDQFYKENEVVQSSSHGLIVLGAAAADQGASNVQNQVE